MRIISSYKSDIERLAIGIRDEMLSTKLKFIVIQSGIT